MSIGVLLTRIFFLGFHSRSAYKVLQNIKEVPRCPKSLMDDGNILVT